MFLSDVKLTYSDKLELCVCVGGWGAGGGGRYKYRGGGRIIASHV